MHCCEWFVLYSQSQESEKPLSGEAKNKVDRSSTCYSWPSRPSLTQMPSSVFYPDCHNAAGRTCCGRMKDMPLQMPHSRRPTQHLPQICKTLGINLVGCACSSRFGLFMRKTIAACVLGNVDNRGRQRMSTEDVSSHA